MSVSNNLVGVIGSVIAFAIVAKSAKELGKIEWPKHGADSWTHLLHGIERGAYISSMMLGGALIYVVSYNLISK
jgi:hypothetical protein